MDNLAKLGMENVQFAVLENGEYKQIGTPTTLTATVNIEEDQERDEYFKWITSNKGLTMTFRVRKPKAHLSRYKSKRWNHYNKLLWVRWYDNFIEFLEGIR